MSYPPPPPLQPMARIADTSALRGATFGQAVQRFWAKYATFNGRASRSEFWWAYLGLVVIYVVLAIIGAVVKFPFLPVIFGLAIIVPTLAMGARRLHDTGKSGWLQLIAIIPFIGSIVLIVLCALPETAEGEKYNA